MQAESVTGSPETTHTNTQIGRVRRNAPQSPHLSFFFTQLLVVTAGLRAAGSFTTESDYVFTPAIGISYLSLGSDVDLNGVSTESIPEIINYGANRFGVSFGVVF